MFTTKRGQFKRSTGFTLVEVTLAIGLVGFAVVALVGSMGVGTTSLGRAVDSTIHGQITKNLMGSLQMSDFVVLTGTSPAGWNGRVTYFNERGVALTGSSNAIYAATTTVQTPVRVPGASDANANLAMATVRIIKNSNPNDAFSMSTIIANNGNK